MYNKYKIIIVQFVRQKNNSATFSLDDEKEKTVKMWGTLILSLSRGVADLTFVQEGDLGEITSSPQGHNI